MTEYRQIGRTMVRALDPRLTVRLRAERRRAEILSAPLRPMSIAVVGPGVGIGRSTVTALLATALGRHQGSGVLALDTGHGAGLHARLALRPGGSTQVVLAGLGLRGTAVGRRPGAVGHRWLRERLALADRTMLLASDPDEAEPPVSAAEYGAVSTALGRWFPVRVVDTPPLTADPVVPAVLTRADRVLLVVPDDERAPDRLARCRSWIAPLLRGPVSELAVQMLVRRDAGRTVGTVAPSRSTAAGEPADLPTFVLPFDPVLSSVAPVGWLDVAEVTREIVLSSAMQIVQDI